jgi:hypothetical protein
MKTRLLIALAALLGATPAQATTALLCRSAGAGPQLRLLMGTGVPGGIFAANLTVGGRARSTQGRAAPIVIAQSWIDRRLLMVDIADRNLERIEARLRARFGRNGVATGTLEVAGRTIRVRCEEA